LHYTTEKFSRLVRIKMVILTVEMSFKKQAGGTIKVLDTLSKKSCH